MNGPIMGVSSTTANEERLNRFTLKELRSFAKLIGVSCGQNKADTVRRLLDSRRCSVMLITRAELSTFKV